MQLPRVELVGKRKEKINKLIIEESFKRFIKQKMAKLADSIL